MRFLHLGRLVSPRPPLSVLGVHHHHYHHHHAGTSERHGAPSSVFRARATYTEPVKQSKRVKQARRRKLKPKRAETEAGSAARFRAFSPFARCTTWTEEGGVVVVRNAGGRMRWGMSRRSRMRRWNRLLGERNI